LNDLGLSYVPYRGLLTLAKYLVVTMLWDIDLYYKKWVVSKFEKYVKIKRFCVEKVRIEALKGKIFNFNEYNENHKVYPQGLVTIHVNILSMHKYVPFFTPACFKSCLFFKFLLIYSKPCLVQLPRPYSFQKISWPPLNYLLWTRSGRFYQEFAWVENSMDPQWK
jgi:hypothetical protein